MLKLRGEVVRKNNQPRNSRERALCPTVMPEKLCGILADCLNTFLDKNVNAKQTMFVDDLFTMLNSTIQDEKALATYLKRRTNVTEGHVPMTLKQASATFIAIQRPEQVSQAMQQCDAFEAGTQLILHGNPHHHAVNISPSISLLRRHYVPDLEFQRCMLLVGTLGNDLTVTNLDDDNAWVIMWKTMQDHLA